MFLLGNIVNRAVQRLDADKNKIGLQELKKEITMFISQETIMKKIKALSIIIFACCFALSLSAQKLDKDLAKGYQSIKVQDVYSYVKTMVHPKFSGRHTGHEGYTRAAQWAASKFRQWGLKPINKKEGYLQAFPLIKQK